ncbi:MAG: cobalt ECF transporter T component CbiQ [Methanosphaera sp. rholeuAM130]|nr:MAG: cobalt ECF transporter T component CbiQ [Methanosphaera sp. rholeuAM130]
MAIFADTLDHYTMNNELTDNNIYGKVIFVILAILLNLATGTPIVPLIIFVICTVLILYVAKIPFTFYVAFMAIPLGFALLSGIFLAFLGTGPHIWDLGFFGIGLSQGGINQALLVFSRVLGGVSALGFLILTTPMNRIFAVFHDVHVPTVVTDLAILMYRYIFLFLDITATMYNSQKTRLGYHSYMNWMTCLASLASMVFIRTWEQGEISYKALASRGYNGRLNMLRDGDSIKDMSLKEWILIILFVILIVAAIIMLGDMNLFTVK